MINILHLGVGQSSRGLEDEGFHLFWCWETHSQVSILFFFSSQFYVERIFLIFELFLIHFLYVFSFTFSFITNQRKTFSKKKSFEGVLLWCDFPHLDTSTWHAKWEVLSLSHPRSDLMPHANAVLLFGSLVPSDPDLLQAWFGVHLF